MMGDLMSLGYHMRRAERGRSMSGIPCGLKDGVGDGGGGHVLAEAGESRAEIRRKRTRYSRRPRGTSAGESEQDRGQSEVNTHGDGKLECGEVISIVNECTMCRWAHLVGLRVLKELADIVTGQDTSL